MPNLRSRLATMIAISLMASTLVLTERPASSHTVHSIPRTATTTQSLQKTPSRQWKLEDTNCSKYRWCWGDDFYTVWAKRSNGLADKATWYFGDLQGTFRLYKEEHKGSPAQKGTYRIRVYEKRTGDGSYRLRYSNHWRNRNRGGFWGGGGQIELDGRVKVELQPVSGFVTARKMRLKFVDLLPELKPEARRMCEAGVATKLKPWATLPTALAAAVVLVYAAPLVFGGGIAALKLRAAKVLARAIPGVTVEDIVKDEIQDRVLERVKDYLSRKVGGIWNDAVDSYQYGCIYFRASWLYLGIARGYGSYADDVAKIWNARRR